MNFYSSESRLPPPLPVNFSRAAFERETGSFSNPPNMQLCNPAIWNHRDCVATLLHCEDKAEIRFAMRLLLSH